MVQPRLSASAQRRAGGGWAAGLREKQPCLGSDTAKILISQSYPLLQLLREGNGEKKWALAERG